MYCSLSAGCNFSVGKFSRVSRRTAAAFNGIDSMEMSYREAQSDLYVERKLLLYRMELLFMGVLLEGDRPRRRFMIGEVGAE